ncbi:MAG: hypothetical protein ACREQH_07145, partial [Candidatus Binatus sp.]
MIGNASKVRVGATAAAFLLLVIVMPCAARAARNRGATADQGLFERSPLGFSWQTLEHVRDRIANAPQLIAEIPQQISRQVRSLGPQGTVLRLLLVVTIILGLLARRRILRWIEARFASRASRLSGKGALLISSASKVVGAVAVPLALWALYLFVAALTDFYNPAFVVFGMLLLAWTEYELATSVARELIVRPLLDIPPEHRRYLYRIAWLLAVYGIFIDALLESAAKLGALPDAIALFRWIFDFSLIVFLAVALLRRRAVMALFPQMPNRMYRGFVRGLDRMYPLVFTLTLIMALLQWAGYHRLAAFVWIRTWAVAGLFVVAMILHQALRSSLHRLILGDEVGPQEARTFYTSARRLLEYFGSIIVIMLALELTGLRAPMGRALSIRLANLGSQPLTPLVLIEAVAIVAGFIFAAQLLRDYLEYQVYPSLNVDPGVAHAIDTFI